MKNLMLFSTLACFGFLSSCNDMSDNEGKTRIIQDSLNTVLPTWQALKIEVESNREQMTIVVGDATFYKASPGEKSKKAVAVGKLVERIYGKSNYLKKGNLIVTSDVRNESKTPADGINIPINFDSLKKVVYPD